MVSQTLTEFSIERDVLSDEGQVRVSEHWHTMTDIFASLFFSFQLKDCQSSPNHTIHQKSVNIHTNVLSGH